MSDDTRLQFRSNDITMLRYVFVQCLGNMAKEWYRHFLYTNERKDMKEMVACAWEMAIAACKHEEENATDS